MPVITVSDGVSHLSGTAGQITLSASGKNALAGGNDITLALASPFAPGALQPPDAVITAASGTGITVNNVGEVRRLVYKVTTTFAAFSAGAKTKDITIATLPAKTRLEAIYADTTVAYTGGGETAATLKVGTTAGGVDLVGSHDVFAGAVTKGLADADLGSLITRAGAIQAAYTPSFSATQIVNARITTTTNNTSSLTAGSTTFYLITTVLP